MYLLNSACLESQIQLIRKIRFPHNLVLGYTFFFFFFFGKEESWEREEEGEERKEGRPGQEERGGNGEGNVKMLLWGCLWYSQKEEVLV